MKINSIESLYDAIALEEKLRYLFFWGHTNKTNQVTKSCFSQWYESPFTIDDITYPTAEHYMMAEKAKLFGDESRWEQILHCNHPGEAKKIGRKVQGFQQDIWRNHRFEIVVGGNTAKFSQNESLKEFLLHTNDRVLVEASPYDRIWGIGLAQDHPDINNPWKWKGLNLLGFALMEVRTKLAISDE